MARIPDPMVSAISAHGRYRATSMIGKGSYGSVYEGCVLYRTVLSLKQVSVPELITLLHMCRVDSNTGNEMALKVIDLDEMYDTLQLALVPATRAQTHSTSFTTSSPNHLHAACRDDDISDVMQEISALANCDCASITKYYNSLLLPNSSKLLIAMELMCCSGSDLARSLASR